jgi:ribosomal protein S3AE
MAERKKYIEVKIPILNSTTKVLGTPENLHNKTIKLDLTRQLRGKGLTIKLKIFNQERNLIAIPNTLELSTSYIRRMMRKRANYVEDSFKAKCADIRATIKPFLITRKKVSRVVRKNLRNTAREFITEYIKEKDFNQICNEIISGELQKTMLPKLKKIYPLSFCEIRKFETKELKKSDIKKASETKVEPEIERENTQEEEIKEEVETEKETEEKDSAKKKE